MTRRLYVPIEYHHYSPHPVILGLRRCPPCREGAEVEMLRDMFGTDSGWQTLSVCEQRPVRWGFGCTLRPIVEVEGRVASYLPRDSWHPVGS